MPPVLEPSVLRHLVGASDEPDEERNEETGQQRDKGQDGKVSNNPIPRAMPPRAVPSLSHATSPEMVRRSDTARSMVHDLA